MQKLVNIYKFVIVIMVMAIIIVCGSYRFGISPVSKESKEVVFEVTKDSTYLTLASELKENGLIRSETFYKVYIKIFNPESLQAGIYNLNQNMNVEQIVSVLSEGSTYNPDAISMTFKEGINMRDVIEVITLNTNNVEDDIYAKLVEEKYLDSLVEKYWFIESDIKKTGIYYSLEGYLYPDTYEYQNKSVSVEEIFEKMLDRMSEVLEGYKDKIENSEYTVHELLTLASIVELEAGNSSDRNGVAGVFYNRLEDNWSLGSDVTTYYAVKVDMSERDLYQYEIDDVNDYNTRPSEMAGKLPISPICLPSSESIEAVINPTNHDYYYFVADKNKKTYFNKDYEGHKSTIDYLKDEDLWFVY